MLKQVAIFFTGIEQHALLGEFFSQKRTWLAQRGIAYPDSLRQYATPFGYTQRLLKKVCMENNMLSLQFLLRQLHESLEQSPFRYETLCLTGFLFSRHVGSQERLITACRKVFPGAEVRAFCVLERQDLLLEDMYAWRLLAGRFEPVEVFLGKQLPHISPYDKTLAAFKRLCGERVFRLPASGKEKILPTACAFLGISNDELEKVNGSSFTPQMTYRLPRDFLSFTSAVNDTPFGHKEMLPWASQVPRFTRNSGYDGDWRSWMTPEQRKEILGLFAASNARISFTGEESLHENSQGALAPWKPFERITREKARHIARRLDGEYIETLLQDYSFPPLYYRNRDQRICCEAIEDEFQARKYGRAPRPNPVPKVSVLTLTYNHAEYIEENIRSVAAQSVDFPIEHIIADDGSDDGTQEIIRAYAARYPHIVPVFQKTHKGGGAANVLSLLGMARSPYVAMCEGDDYFTDPEKLKIQADFLDGNPSCALCFHPVKVVYEDQPDWVRYYPPLEQLPGGIKDVYSLPDLLTMNFIQTNSVMYRWRFINGVPSWFDPKIFPGDWYLNILHAEIGEIGFINKIMGVYRRHHRALFYEAEIDTLAHRNKFALRELLFFQKINEHLEFKFNDIVIDMINGVLADCYAYGIKNENMFTIDSIAKKFPQYVNNFLQEHVLKKM